MNHKVLVFAGLVSMTGLHSAVAADGTIQFNGEITSQTCNVGINSTGAQTVTLPTVSAKQLDKVGSTASLTAFTIQLSGCVLPAQGAKTSVAAFFESGGGVDQTSGRLKNTGTAKNVSLELGDGLTQKAIDVGKGTQRTSSSRITLNSSAGSTTELPYYVRYYADGQAEAGTVVGAVTYSIDYQ